MIVSITFDEGHKTEATAAKILDALLHKLMPKATRQEHKPTEYKQINYFLTFKTAEELLDMNRPESQEGRTTYE